jgi:hypothetical protein
MNRTNFSKLSITGLTAVAIAVAGLAAPGAAQSAKASRKNNMTKF